MKAPTHILLCLGFDEVAHVAGFPLPPLGQICVSPGVHGPLCHQRGLVSGHW